MTLEAPGERTFFARWEPAGTTYDITRNVFLRSLGFIYFVAFLSLNRQVLALLGKDGLLPATLFLQNLRQEWCGASFNCFGQLPSIFWFNCSDWLLLLLSWVGLALSVLIIAGATNAALMVFQWFLYMSFVHIGQVFYGYGWETMMLEAGFLAIFLCPLRSLRPNPPRYPTPIVLMWFYRWMIFRTMFGAGMIKIHGDECWRNLTCLAYHYETQPIPNPISWYLHHMPMWFHQCGCLFNHFVELIVPWFYFAPRRLRHVAGALTVLFQVILIISGNLSFLNWLTIVITIPCFDDRLLARFFRMAPEPVAGTAYPAPFAILARKVVLTCLTVLLLWLSYYPISNIFSSRQLMNASFNRLHLMNTYGAFGSVGTVRNEIILEGTTDSVPDDTARWKAYEFLAKPGDPARRPVFIAPYQSRIDWQIWFAAMEDPGENPWLLHLVYKLLKGDRGAIGLLKTNPFPGQPPRYIRADLYEYHFTRDHSKGLWWDRKLVGSYLPPLSAGDSRLQTIISAYGWKN